MSKTPTHDMAGLIELMARLRDPDKGCPWDQAQDFATIAPYTLEEAFEVVDTIEREAWDELLGELGDLLFQVVFHARMAEERGWFDFADVAAAIVDKMIRRHPHVFGDLQAGDVDDLREQWDGGKAAERADKNEHGVLDGVALALPALVRAEKLQRRAARVGLDWDHPAGVRADLEQTLLALDQACRDGDADQQKRQLGDVLFSAVNLARHLGIDAEQALRASNHRFERRVSKVETQACVRGVGLDAVAAEQLDTWWQEAKA